MSRRHSDRRSLSVNNVAEAATSESALESQTASLLYNPANARKLDAAHKHLDRLFADATSEQIDGRKFFGSVAIRIYFEDGNAQEINADKLARDRCAGGR